jgi:hypothetical protein
VTGKDGEPPLYLAAQENQVREYIRTNSSARAVDKDTLYGTGQKKKLLDEPHNEREIMERRHCI